MFRKLCLWYKQILSHEGGGGWREREREGGSHIAARLNAESVLWCENVIITLSDHRV